MDGLQGGLNHSIQRRLSLSLSLLILVAAALAGLFAFTAAFDDARALQDDLLRQIAALVGQHQWALSADGDPRPSRPLNEESRVIVQRLGARTSLDIDEGGVLPLPTTLRDGLQTLVVHGEAFRVFVATLSGGERIAVAQEEELRDDTARAGAVRTVAPFLALVPVLLLIVAHLLRKTLRPVGLLAQDLAQRDEHDLRPVASRDVPSEVRPFVEAINLLLAKAARAMDAQRRFVADAAHELRSPLTAMSLQAEHLAESALPAPARQRLQTLRHGIERGRNLLDQLLALARVQSRHAPADAQASVSSVFRTVLEDLVPLAEAKRIDLGVEGALDLQLRASEFELVLIVKNLVDNAIRYTPAGGRVDLSTVVGQQDVALLVRDSGPGMPAHERERAFDPFYRVLGTEQLGAGLGLSIVKAAAERIGGRISLAYADEQRMTGLCASLSLPRDRICTDPLRPQVPHGGPVTD